jgi:Transglycosylase SLT domain
VSVLVTRKSDAPAASVGPQVVGRDPLMFDASRTARYARAAAFGLGHVLYAKSPGGVVTAARRTAAFRPLVEAAVAGSGFDADTVEAIVLLESAGRPEVIAGDDPANAAGLTQIVAETGTNLLGMRVDLAASRTLTRRIDAAANGSDEEVVRRLRAERRRVDTRFDPARALAATVRYLTFARRQFGRDDLAVVSYHMGIGNLTNVLRAYAGKRDLPIRTIVDEGDLSWARIYFDSSPARHPEAWQRMAALGDDSQTYYWHVLAAREIMRLFRSDPATLEQLARLHGHGPSAEAVLHPPETTKRFASRDDLSRRISSRRCGSVSSCHYQTIRASGTSTHRSSLAAGRRH